MFDLKVLHSAMDQLEEEKGVSKEAVFEAIETSLAAAYKKEYGRRGQIIRADFDIDSGKVEFSQVKVVVDKDSVRMDEGDESEDTEPTILVSKQATVAKKSEEKKENTEDGEDPEDERPRYNSEHHIFLEDAQKIKKDAKLDDEIVFQLEERDDFGRIAAQTAKQVIIQKIREAERKSVLKEYGGHEGEVVSGTVERIDRGAILIDLGKATGYMSYEDQIPRERFRQGERIRGYLYAVEETPRGISLRVSRSRPEFLKALFTQEVPEMNAGTVVMKAVAREPGSRAKIAVSSPDEHIDPIGACVGQRGVRVTTVMSELGGEKIDVIEWSEDPVQFIADALAPAHAESVEVNEEDGTATVVVGRDELSLAIGRNGQNARLAAKLTGWKIDIQSRDGETEEAYDPEGGKEVIAVPAEEEEQKADTAPEKKEEKEKSEGEKDEGATIEESKEESKPDEGEEEQKTEENKEEGAEESREKEESEEEKK